MCRYLYFRQGTHSSQSTQKNFPVLNFLLDKQGKNGLVTVFLSQGIIHKKPTLRLEYRNGLVQASLHS